MAEFDVILGYQVLTTLGYGARSTIYAVQDKKGQVFSLKRVVKSSSSDQRFLDQAVLEHRVSSQMEHPVLRRSLKLFRQREFIRTSEVLVLMEMVEGLTLEQHQPGSLVDLIKICRDVAKGLAAMHVKGYAHADIKPNNIMVDVENRVKIIDFGQSCPTGTIKERIQGTPDYIAPEQVLRRRITPETDIFNLGATLYWLLTRKHVPTLIPKGRAGINLRTNQSCTPPNELNVSVPPALTSLVMACIQTEPGQRPSSMEDVAERLGIAVSQITRQGEKESSTQQAGHRDAG